MTLDVLKKQSGTATDTLGIAALRNPVGNFGNFENRIGFGLNALQFARAVKRGDPLA